jgi:hypothetical protein
MPRKQRKVMELNKLVFGGLALGCMAAAAGGGYLAARQSPAPAATVAVAPAPGTDATDPAAKPVTESEGVITPATPPVVTTAPASEPLETAPRREASTRPSRVTSRPQNARQETPRATPSAGVTREVPARTTRTEPAAADNPPAASPAPTSGGMWETRPTVTPERAPVVEPEPEPPPPPPAPEFVELVVPSDAVMGLQIERTISSETARVEDRVEARVTRDIRVGDRVAIPAGSVVHGSVMEVERGGKVKEKARLGIRFHTVVLDSGTRLAIKTDSVIREGASPAKESAAKIGGAAIGGAILGAILGGGKGAVIGGATGAAGGTAATMAGDRNPAVLTQGTTVTVRIQQPVTVTVEK